MLQFRFLNHKKKKKKFRNDKVIAKTKLIQNMENPKSQEFKFLSCSYEILSTLKLMRLT